MIRNYRGIRKDNGEWVYGWYCKVNKASIIIPSQWIEDKTKTALEFDDAFNVYSLDADCVEVHPSTVGQQVGLKDKNGKEIYANDKMQSKDSLREYIVTWQKAQGYWYLLGLGEAWVVHTPMWEEYEIIGTIHDKLLEQE